MKAFIIPTAVMLAMAAAAAQAHVHLKQSTPAEGAVVTEMPAAIELTFSESARVTAVSLRKDQEPKQTLKEPAGAAAEHISVAVPQLVRQQTCCQQAKGNSAKKEYPDVSKG